MTATLPKPVDTSKLANAQPGIYPYELWSGRYAGRIAAWVPPTYMPRVQQIPGALYSKADQVWTLPKAWPAVLALSAMAKETGLPILPEPSLNAWVTEQAEHWAALTKLAAAYDKDAVKGEDEEFFPHQEADGDWLAYGGGVEPTRGRLLNSETGIGKTAGLINGMRKLEILERGPVLVVAPKKTLRRAWEDDLARFYPEARVEVALGTATQRRKAIERVGAGEADVLVIGWEALRSHTRYAAFPGQALKKCQECGGPQQSEENTVSEARCQAHQKELNKIGWALIVCDELHRAMNNTSNTTQALWGVIKSAPFALRWGATGTPVSTRVEQTWSALHTADPLAWPVKSSWVEYYAETGYNMAGYFETHGFKPQRKEEFQQVYRAISRRRLKAEVLDLPPLIMGGGMIREVEMGKEQASAYKQMRDELIMRVKEGVIVAPSPMVAAGRLTMLASATGYPDPVWEAEAAAVEAENVARAAEGLPPKPLPPIRMLLRLPSGKIDSVIEDLTSGEFDGQQIAMSFESRRLLRLTVEAMQAKGFDADEIACVAGDMTQDACDFDVKEFQAGRKRFMLYTYGAGGTGLTMTAASTLLRVQRTWSPILWKQGLDRVHRIGSEQHKQINVIDYVTAGTIEEKQIDRYGQNTALLDDLTEDWARLLALFDPA